MPPSRSDLVLSSKLLFCTPQKFEKPPNRGISRLFPFLHTRILESVQLFAFLWTCCVTVPSFCQPLRSNRIFLALFAIREYRMDMLKSQDIVVILKIVAQNDADLSFARLSVELEMSSSEVHAAVKRAVKSGLMQVEANAGASHRKSANRHALLEFLIHGLKYVFPAERGGETRGMPTGLFAPNVSQRVVGEGSVPVWPDPTGEIRGYEFRPLFRSVPAAAKRDSDLYVLLALVDALRGGSARERNIAAKELTRRIVGEQN